MNEPPNRSSSWIEILSEEEMQFIKQFVLASGSIKELASRYEVSYPTIRLRLDGLIQKIHIIDNPENTNQFHRFVRLCVADGELSVTSAKKLILEHEAELKRNSRS